MGRFARRAVLCLVSAVAVLLAACGGGGGNGGGGGGGNKTTPTVRVTPAKTSIGPSDSLQVTVTVSGSSSTPTGSVTLTSGSYNSSATALSGGSATITIPAGKLAAGTATLSASYAPDSSSSSNYNSASGSATVTVTSTTIPTVTVTPAANSITIAQSLQVTIALGATPGSATPTGTVTLSSGSYSSATTTLSTGSATITVPAGSLALGSNTLTASYTPDTASSSVYTPASGSATVSVTVVTPTVTVTPAAPSIGTGQDLGVTVTVAGFSGGPVPTGSVTLTGANGSYSSGAKVLTAGSATITIPGGTLAAGSAKLTASYSPDTAGSAVYASASGSTTVTVTSQLTPTVSVAPASQSLATSSSLSVTVKVTGTGAPPTGSVILSSGSYVSSATPLVSGSATILIPAYSLVYGSDTLSAAYTPDAASSAAYASATGTSAPVSVARATPTVTVTPASLSINTAQSVDVTVAVSGGAGAPAATGTISVIGGGYTSPSPVTLSAGSATITIAAGALAAGSDTLTATYTPDTAGSTLFNSKTGQSTAITVITMSTIRVNQSTTLAPVTNQLLGMNLANWYDVVGNASSINAAFSKAGIKAIRWPGGSWSDIWHWRTSATNLLPYNCNDPGPGTGWGGYSPFADFITSIAKGGNYDLALTANYGSNATCNGGGDPTEAAGWVAEAASEGFAPSHVTVGNENYGSWEFDLHTNKWDPTTYANSVVGATGYYQLIKNASPTTSVGVVVDAGTVGGNGLANWDPVVLANAKYDFVEYHYYPQYGSVTNDNYLVYQAALDFTTNIKTIKSELTAAGNTNPIPIYVGELGGNSANPGTQSWSITQGLYAGQILGEAMNEGISRLTWWIGFGNCLGNAGSGSNPNNNNSNPSLYGWQNTWGALSIFSDIDPNCPGAGPIGTMSPTAQAFNLFQTIAVTGENALSTTFTGDSTNIRAYAATHYGGTALFLFNLNKDQSEPVTITLSKQSASNDVTVTTYDKSIYDQSNPANAGGAKWTGLTTTDLGAKSLPLTFTLTPWSMNVVEIK